MASDALQLTPRCDHGDASVGSQSLLCPQLGLEGNGRNEASGLINYIKKSSFMLMECEEADVLEMIYNISYFSEEKNDKLDDV